MPLIRSTSDEARSRNIATERREGRPEAQAVAIGHSEQRRARRKMTLEQAKKRRRAKTEAE